MKRTLIMAGAALFLISGCDSTSPSINADFPVFYLQDVTTGALPTSCAFLGGDGDIIAGAGNYVYFVDRDAGYVRAEVSIGVPVTDADGSPEGGYGLVLSGAVLSVIPDGIYTVQQQIVLPQVGSFIIPKPNSTSVFVLCADGTMVKIETVGWSITKVGQTGLSDPAGAVMGSSGQYIFAADSDGTVYKISTADFSIAAQTTVTTGVNGIASSPLGVVYVSPEGESQVWAIDCGTGQHTDTYSLPAPSSALAVTGSGKYIYASVPGYGFAVVNTLDGNVEAVIDNFGEPVDMAINDQDTRAVICSISLFILQK